MCLLQTANERSKRPTRPPSSQPQQTIGKIIIIIIIMSVWMMSLAANNICFMPHSLIHLFSKVSFLQSLMSADLFRFFHFFSLNILSFSYLLSRCHYWHRFGTLFVVVFFLSSISWLLASAIHWLIVWDFLCIWDLIYTTDREKKPEKKRERGETEWFLIPD